MVRHSSLTKGSFAEQLHKASGDISMDPSPPRDQDEPEVAPKQELFTREEMQAFVKQEVKREREELEASMQASFKALLDARESSNIKPESNGIEVEAAPPHQEELMQLVDDKPPKEQHLEEEVELHAPFGETIYTLLYLSKANSQGFLYSIMVWAIQMSMIILTLADQIDIESVTNKLRIPPMVGVTVTIVQALSLFILLAYVSDLLEAILKLQDGYYPEVNEKQTAATFSKWLFSCIAQLLAGLLLVFASLILTMVSETVIDVVLNLTALLFITELDDLGFALAKMGFVTNKLQKIALSVEDIQVPKHTRVNLYRRVAYVLGLIGLFIGYAVVKHKQLIGDYLPTHVYVQFGDEFNPEIPYYSGILTAGKGWTPVRREYRDIATQKVLLLGYCLVENSWTFSDSDDPCDYFAKSLETTTFDVTTLPDSDWEVKDSIGRMQPFESFSLVSRDCNPETCQEGKCEGGLCQCPPYRFGMDCEFCFGMDCEFSDVCQVLEVDKRFGPFPAVQLDLESLGVGSGFRTFGVSSKFQLLEKTATKEFAKVYSMPVYYSNKTWPAEVLFFGGRRWLLSTEWDLINMTELMNQSPGARFFPEKTIGALEENDFYGQKTARNAPWYISDPVDFETPDFRPSPIGLGWYRTKEDRIRASGNYVPDVPVDTMLTCIPPTTPPESCLGKSDVFCGIGFCNPETGFCQCLGLQAYGAIIGDRCESFKPCYEASCFGRGDCDTSTGFCRCNAPYLGELCTANYQCYEEDGQCKHEGVCNVTTGACMCPKDPAIFGAACEKRASCLYFGCANGGICGTNGNCICRPPYHGTHCDLVNKTQEELFCSKNEDCMNGTCNIDTGICSCEDPLSYGTLCQHQFSCSEVFNALEGFQVSPCLNDGICNAATGLCNCPEPYFGPDCSQVPPCRSNDDCGDPIANKCDIDTGFCRCLYGPVQGKRCEKQGGRCTVDGCYGGGVCRATGSCEECYPGLGGSLCESIVGEYSVEFDEWQAELEDLVENCGFDDPACCSMENPPSPEFCNE